MLQVGNMYEAKAWDLLTVPCALPVLQVNTAVHIATGKRYWGKAWPTLTLCPLTVPQSNSAVCVAGVEYT